MILAWLILIPLVGGLLAWLVGRGSARASRWVALLAMLVYLALAVAVWAGLFGQGGQTQSPGWMVDFNLPWIPQFGISLHLAVDGLSIILLVLTGVLGVISVAASWTEIEERVGFFHFSLLWVLAGITGVFLSLDLFLFYFFWEMMLVPMYFLIAFWGHENRAYAAVKFFLFTQLSGLLMLVAILGLYFIHGQSTGTYTFDYFQLLGTQMSPQAALWLMLGFLVAFAVKLPIVPVHTWLPDAHTEAPTAGSIVLAGLLLKTGAYGLIRFVVPLFPSAALSLTPLMMILAVIGILYGALLAFGQTDLKRLVAYTSISHMGFVVLGVFAWNQLALQGAVMQIVSHGISTGALFALVGALQERTHTREMGKMGGLWETMPRIWFLPWPVWVCPVWVTL
jgi:NADH-quinone oxidoreductase subunit M